MADANVRRNAHIVKRRERHGKRYLPEYQIWLQMKGRCQNPRNKAYRHYGGRGISVCERWCKSFNAFYEDMGPRPEGMTLERKNKDGNYEPSNCVWDSWDTQRHNKRNNVWITFNGRTMIRSDWEKELGLRRGTLNQRMNGYGWSLERAMTTPVGSPGKNSRFLTLEGKTLTMTQWARLKNIDPRSLKSRLYNGWPIDLALNTPIRK